MYSDIPSGIIVSLFSQPLDHAMWYRHLFRDTFLLVGNELIGVLIAVPAISTVLCYEQLRQYANEFQLKKKLKKQKQK